MKAKNLHSLKTTLIIFAFSLFFWSFKVAAIPIISIDHPDHVLTGNEFDVTINISGVNSSSIWPLRDWSLYLGFSDSMAPVDYIEGDFGGIGGNGLLNVEYQPGALPRFLKMSQSTSCDQFCSDVFNQESTFPLITVRFKALKYNSAADFVIYKDYLFRDIYNQDIPVEFDKARPSRFSGWTIVSDPITIPEPNGLTMMGLGLIALFFYCRRNLRAAKWKLTG